MRSQAASVAAGAPSGNRCHVTSSHAQREAAYPRYRNERQAWRAVVEERAIRDGTRSSWTRDKCDRAGGSAGLYTQQTCSYIRTTAPAWQIASLPYWRMHGYSNNFLCCPSLCRKLIPALSRCFGVMPLNRQILIVTAGAVFQACGVSLG